jgi:hypothetical protein
MYAVFRRVLGRIAKASTRADLRNVVLSQLSLVVGTDSIRGIFRLFRLYGDLLRYGMDKGDDGCWGGLLRPVLEKLAGTEAQPALVQDGGTQQPGTALSSQTTSSTNA